jgi:hypothetical protein
MEYNAGVKHREIFSTSNITVPQSLLKIDDLKRTYTSLHQIEYFTKNKLEKA